MEVWGEMVNRYIPDERYSTYVAQISDSGLLSLTPPRT
jgi:hypothetical protein